LNELIYKRTKRAQRIFSGHRRPDAQCELLNGLLICDVLGRPWLQMLRRLFLRITLDPLARDLFTFASRNGTVAERNDLAVVAHRRRPFIHASAEQVDTWNGAIFFGSRMYSPSFAPCRQGALMMFAGSATTCRTIVGVKWSVTVPFAPPSR